MQLIKAYKTEAKIQGVTKTVLISVEVETEDADFSYWDEKDVLHTQSALNRGSTQCLWVRVTARFADLAHYEGSDSLGQVFVRSSAMEKDVMQTVQVHYMEQNATQALIQFVERGHVELSQFLGKVS